MIENRVDENGLVHTVLIEETNIRFGALDCGLSYTRSPKLGDVRRVVTKIVRRHPTCVACIARLLR